MLVPVQVKPVTRGLSSNSGIKVRPTGIRPNLSACVSGGYKNGRVCLSLPVIGSLCITTGGPNISATVRCCASISVWPPGADVCCTIPVIGKQCVSV